MCLDCERDEMLAAYREYAAQRRAAAAAARSGQGAPADGAGTETPDWAKGTWFAAAIEREA